MTARLLCLSALLALSACAPREADEMSRMDPDARVESVAQLEARLGSTGFLLQPRGFSTDPLVPATAAEYVLGGTGQGFLQAYTFSSEAEAQRNLNEVAASGGATRVRVYQSGPLVVAYYGSDTNVGATLTRLLGPPQF